LPFGMTLITTGMSVADPPFPDLVDRPTLAGRDCVRSLIEGSNADLFAAVCRLWIDLEHDVVVVVDVAK
jgi:hypothetical protein